MLESSQGDSHLEPPKLPLFSRSTSSVLSNDGLTSGADSEDKRVSLTVNYLPAKFSTTLLSEGPKRRKAWRNSDSPLPKQGGGREVFRRNEARMPGDDDEDLDGVEFDEHTGGHARPKQRWNRFKWMLLVANLIFTLYSIAALVVLLLIWFNTWEHADIIRVGNKPELIVSTCAAALGVFTALVGWSGILLNNRAFLSVYCALLWAVFALLVTPGYMTYKQRAFNLEGKINQQWSQQLGLDGRVRIQNQLHCCGYFSPFVEATASATCYARSVLPGCKAPYLRFERTILEWWYTVVFALVPAHIAVILAGLLCSNHITYRFGKGMMPKAYRLDVRSLAVIMDNYTSQLAEEYGAEMTSEFISKSRSSFKLDAMPTVAYSRSQSSSLFNRVDSFLGRAPRMQGS
ncbi:hypothetical protein DAEQUDRAFT_703788 [Daedalea quercina L-15889]|uniref:Tetraspanin Tsp2 n=1 Tax=Daedalea quercina L-15889 TaxID=1314783 RepID=A0A165TG54_9APHY|nr:hypothetical protein DAEQUDRAFT_703788 [Daedalea quercina L-15889]